MVFAYKLPVLFITMFYLIAVNCTLMSRTKRETSADVNVVLILNKSCFLYLCFSSFFS